MKKLVLIIFVFLTLLVSCIIVNADNIPVRIDGIYVAFNADTGYPFIHNSRTYVPLRVTMEAFGAEVDWESDTSTAVIRKGTTTVRCCVGDNWIYRNNTKIVNDAATVINNGRVYLPIRVVLEAFGATVEWDGSVNISSGSGASLISAVENTPSVTGNYWGIWNEALWLKSCGRYSEAINKIMSVSSAFISTNQPQSNAMLFKHLGELYSYLGNYDNASACFARESYYWSLSPGMEQSRIDSLRRSNLIKTNVQIYVKTTDENMGSKKYFGAQLESKAGIYLGAYAEGDTKIYNPYNPSKFYMDTFPDLVEKDMAAYLLYLPYGTNVTHYNSHIRRAINEDKILQIALEPHAGLRVVKDSDNYLKKLAQTMERSNCRFMLRFAGEMNDPGCPWYDADPTVYIEKFRLVADIFHRYAPSVPVVWAPNYYPEDTIDDYYPGDDYVDYVGMSSYKMEQPITDPMGQGIDRSRWSNQLDRIYSLYGHKKPIVVVEGGASYINYDTGADISDFAAAQLKDFYTYLPIKYPNVKMCFIFDSDRERQKFSLSNNYQYLSAYKEAISNPLYLSNMVAKKYRYSYYEISNGVNVKPEATSMASYIITPYNDVSYVIYYINGVELGVTYAIPYEVNVDFTPYKGQRVNVKVCAFNSNHAMISSSEIGVNVMSS
ncbi:MAG: hypothetical protein II998_02620 [Clostridia bacterium]|nr:hypothetical protein [Clostridia bacterium]